MPNRSRNPVQMIQGYVQRGETVTLNTIPPQTIQVQKSYPEATVTVLSRLPNGVDTEFATIFNRDGTPAANPITAGLDGYYSFYGQPGRYDIEFSGTGVTTPFKLKDVPVESLVFDVRDYGAKGDGVTDDTLAIQAALDAMIAAHTTINGVGTLFFPNGKYLVSRQQHPFIFDLPSGIIIQGTAGPYTGADQSNCQIVLTSELTSIFRIKTERHKIFFRDIGMTNTVAGVDTGCIAIEAREIEENFKDTYSSNIEFDNVTIWHFERGISIEGSGDEFQWDITGVRVNHCIIIECRYGIYINSQNCDFMKITDSRVGAITGGFGIYMEKVGIISIDSVLGAGPVTTDPAVRADTYIYITAAHATVTISGCECEGYNNSIQVVPLAVGNFSWPILLINCALGATVKLSSQCEIVSVASKYLPDTVQCDPNVEAMIYSFGDSMVDVNKHADPLYDFNLNGSDSRLVSRANRFRVDFQRPARFGGQAGQVAPWLEHTALAISPFTSGHAQIALCDESGAVLFHVRADADFIYFEDPRPIPSRKLMKLDRDGNLTVRGNVIPLTNP